MAKKPEFNNIVFDLGGVIVDIDINSTINALKRTLNLPPDTEPFKIMEMSVFHQYETGTINSSQFINRLSELSGTGVKPDLLIEAWNAMLVTIPEKRINLIEKLSGRFRLFVLSNTNALHAEKFEKMAPGYENLSQLFEKMYYSHLIGCRKPQAKAFTTVIDDSGIQPTETLFVDDLQTNITMARQLHFQTLQVNNGTDITELMKHLIT
ncbi:HAD family hydrolase [Geofilum sp. OHC36d9]|uniref:HAD family hydrolase n=1 Tax=Geofilum sp. OHC36d9 TaxID=3458413 RepID=UPI0040332799